ncbi:hypothetical protein C5Y96_17110 [Blastopirellula marina]|uniref:Terminase large subunit n=1 Tax=Blastopirellula marina TaxID=124 RepID=A0A2S8F7H9_9BACT|nr:MULTISPECIES: terminase TerL endonuclease subunit [Pirellulaceae]PQO28090.1 hypothetical protein C5Y96_17110 [Blastopirellula marina]RCS48516.1 terminase large subunit [Bremerella cremea]
MAKRRKLVPKQYIVTDADRKAIKEGCWFDQDAADHVCDFIETFCVYTKNFDDELVGHLVVLLPWQRWFLSMLFGWKRKDGRRRFRAASVWIPKKNGKTTLCAWVILYLLCADGEPAAEVYSAANSQVQAREIWKECKHIIDDSPELAEVLEHAKSTSRVTYEATRSFYAAISSSPKTAEGLNASGVVVDEVHRFDKPRDEDFFNALRWSGKARKNPLFITISTAGVFDPQSTGWKLYKVAKDILQGINTQTDILPLVYEGDPDDNWHTTTPDGKPNKDCEKVWKKSNPSLGIAIDIDDFRSDVEAIEQNPSQLSAFLRYNFNLWQSSSMSWITDDRWMTCQGSTNLSQEQIDSMRWTAGLDMARTIDLTAFVLVGRDDENDKTYVICFFWCSKEQASLRQKRDQVNYETWANAGLIRTHEGEVIDYNKVRADILKICETYPVEKIAIDRFTANATAQQLQDDGLPVVFYGQGFKDMSPAVSEVERLIFSKELVHDNAVLRWMMSNVEIVTDDAGNVKCSRKRSREKIDGVISLCMAVGVGMEPEKKRSVYEDRDIFVV